MEKLTLFIKPKHFIGGIESRFVKSLSSPRYLSCDTLVRERIYLYEHLHEVSLLDYSLWMINFTYVIKAINVDCALASPNHV